MLHSHAGCSDMCHELWAGIAGQRTTEKWRLLGQKSPRLGGHIYHVDSSGTLTIPPPQPFHATRSVVTCETNLEGFRNFSPFIFYLPRITVKPFPSSQSPFEQLCYIFYTPVLFKKWKILGTMFLVSNPFKRLDHIFYNQPGLSLNLMINVHLISIIPVLNLQSRVYYTRTTVVQFPLNLYLFWCFADRASQYNLSNWQT